MSKLAGYASEMRLCLPILLILVGCSSAEDTWPTNTGGGPEGDDSAAPYVLEGDVPANDYCDPVADWTVESAALEERLLELVNEERVQGGMCGSQSFEPSQPLRMHAALRCSARKHSLDMKTRGYFRHTNPDGEGPSERAQRAGFGGSAGENIAAGQWNPEQVHAGWMNSGGHCSNILNENYQSFGAGFVQGGAFGTLWTQNFG